MDEGSITTGGDVKWKKITFSFPPKTIGGICRKRHKAEAMVLKAEGLPTIPLLKRFERCHGSLGHCVYISM